MKEKIQELERQIAALPIGYISKKTINGKTRYYHQWTENGKKHSQYLRDGELEPLREQIEQRKVLQAVRQERREEQPLPAVRQSIAGTAERAASQDAQSAPAKVGL